MDRTEQAIKEHIEIFGCISSKVIKGFLGLDPEEYHYIDKTWKRVFEERGLDKRKKCIKFHGMERANELLSQGYSPKEVAKIIKTE